MSVIKRARGGHRGASIVVSILLASYATAAAAAIPVSERTVLLNLYTSTNGSGWTTKTNWNGAAGTECTWYGVTCNAGGNTVLRIQLPNNNLAGSLPAIAGLTDLQVLWVSGNQLIGSIPPLNSLTNLYYFNADGNQLTGAIPALTGLTKLEVFGVNSNQLSSIPGLGGLTALQYFGAYSNKLAGPIPVLTGLTDLQVFSVSGNQLIGSLPLLNGLTNLQYFNASENQLTGPIPALTGLTKLEVFGVNTNQLSSIPGLGGLTALKYFGAYSNRLTGSIPVLTGLTSLRNLVVSYNQLTGNVPAAPSPSALVAGGSYLCPNGLNHTEDAAWDVATGVSPWYTNCATREVFFFAQPGLPSDLGSLSFAPTVSATGATAITATTATLNGTVSSNGKSATVTFQYGPTVSYGSSPTAAQSPLAAGASNAAVSVALTGLTCNTPYHFRVVGANSVGTTNSADATFTTAACTTPAPTVATNAASGVTATGATLNGTVSSNGASTTVSFQYGLTTSYGSTAVVQSPLASSATNAAVSAALTGLTCYAQYHFRVVGANSGGTTNGADATFITDTCPVTLTAPSACSVSATPTSLPAGGGSVALRVSCGSGGAPTAYTWTASPSVTYSSGGATTVPSNGATITQTTAFTVVARNAAGSSPPATVSLPVGAPSSPPSGCTASANPTSLPSTGGTVSLNANCTSPGSGTTYSWAKNGALFSTAQNPTDALPANLAATAVTYAYRATACLAASPQTCTVIAPAIAVTVAATSVSPATSPGLNQHGLTGSWYEPATSGQGFAVQIIPNQSPGIGQAFVSWFTFDPLSGGAERQRWYTLQGPVVTGQANASLTIYQNSGGNFNAPPATNAQAVGTATLSFDTCTSGNLTYTFTDGSGRTGTVPLTRLLPNVTCSVPTPYPTNADFALSGSWYAGPATSGQGFTAEVAPSSGAFFLSWFTYMPNGASAGAAGQRWYTAEGTFTPGLRSIQVQIFETTGGRFDTLTPSTQKTVLVGTGTMTFQSCTAATFSYYFTGGTTSGLSGLINLTRVGPVPPGCTQ